MSARTQTEPKPKGVSEDRGTARTPQKCPTVLSKDAARSARSITAAAIARERRNASRITVGKWTIERADPLNWTLRADAEPDRYFPDLTSACTSLLRERIGDHARRDIKGVLQAVRLAEQEIVAAVTRLSVVP